MLEYPVQTTREQKLEFIHNIKDRFLERYKESILAIGIYGSVGKEKEGPYSDIEMHVVTANDVQIRGEEFIYLPFKLEISVNTIEQLFNKAKRADDMWPIRSGSYIHVIPLYDPHSIFEQLKQLPMQVTEEQLRDVMREFMIWESYETMGKIRNAWHNQELAYLTQGALDLAWQTAKLIGLANKRYYTTRATTFAESLEMGSIPKGYLELVSCVMSGELNHKQHIYTLCENLWTGLNHWAEELGVEYKLTELPF